MTLFQLTLYFYRDFQLKKNSTDGEVTFGAINKVSSVSFEFPSKSFAFTTERSEELIFEDGTLIFLDLKMCEYTHAGEEYFGDKIRNMNEQNVCCKNKFVPSKDFLTSLFHDLNTVFYEINSSNDDFKSIKNRNRRWVS